MSDFSTIDSLILLVKKPNNHLFVRSNFKQINWDFFIKYLYLNKTVPFSYHLLNCRRCQKKIPEKTLILLKNNYLSTRLRWIIQKEEKIKICRTLYQKNIIGIPFKDYTFWGLKYPPSIFPQKEDIDIFIQSEDYNPVDRIMLKLLYQPIGFPFPKDKFALFENNYISKLNRFLIINFHFKDVLPGNEGKINPLDQEVIDYFNKIFKKSIRRNKNGFFLPSLELNFIFVCLHFFFRDRFAGLRTLYEISQHVRQFNQKINWDYTLKITQEMKVESYFLFVIKIASLIFDVKLPEGIERRISCFRSVNVALFFYYPILTALPDGPEDFIKPKKNKKFWSYYFFIKLILWQKPFWRKIGPRMLIIFLIYVIPTYFILKRNDKFS